MNLEVMAGSERGVHQAPLSLFYIIRIPLGSEMSLVVGQRERAVFVGRPRGLVDGSRRGHRSPATWRAFA